MELPEELRVPGLTELNLFAEVIRFREISTTVADLDEVRSLEIDSSNQLDELHELSNLSELFLSSVDFYSVTENGGSLEEAVWDKIPDTVTALGLYRCEMDVDEVQILPKKTLKHFSANIQSGLSTKMSVGGDLESISIHIHEDEFPFQLNIKTCEILVLILEGDVVVTGKEAKKVYVYQANPFVECTYDIKLENTPSISVLDGRGFF